MVIASINSTYMIVIVSVNFCKKFLQMRAEDLITEGYIPHRI